MNEELIALYQNIEKHYPGSLGTLEEFNSWAGASRGALKSFLESAEVDFPKAFEAYVPPSMEFEDIQMDAAVDPFGWMDPPGNVSGLPPVPRKPVKRTKEDILGNIFPIPMEDVKSEQRRLADNEMMRVANEKTEGQKLSALIGTRDVFPWETEDVLEEARTSDPRRLVSPWQRDNIEDEAGMTALSTVIDPTEYTPEELARIYKPEEYQNRKREIDLIQRSEDEIGTPKKINERSTMPISMTGYNTREVRLNTSHDDSVRNIEYLTKAGTMSTTDILEADEIDGYSDEELLRMKDALTLDDRLKSEHEMQSLSLYGNILTKRVNNIPQETRDQIKEAWGILAAANTEAESGALSEETLQAAREAASFLRSNQEVVDSYAKLVEQLGSLQSKYEQIGNKYPDLKLADELNKRIQGQVDQRDKKRRSNKFLQAAGKLLWGPLVPVTRPVLEFVPKLLGRISSTIDGELAANGDVSAEIRMLRRSRDRVQSGTFRDPSRVAGSWSRNLTEFEFEGEKYDMAFDGDTPIEIYDKDGYAVDLPSDVKESLMTEGAVLGLHSMAKRQWSSDRMVNTVQDVGSDLLGTFALAFATRGLGSGAVVSKLREFGSIMLQYEGSFVEEGLREGLPMDQAINYGRLKALIEGGWETAFPFISKVTDGRVVGEIKDALKRILAEGDPKKVRAFAVSQIRKNLMGVPQGGLEELGVAITDPFANQILNNAYNVDLDTEFPDLIELGETFTLGAAVYIIPASIGAANTRRKVKGVESLREAVVTAVRDLDGVKAAAAQFNDPKLNKMVPIFEAVANKARPYLQSPNFTDRQITTYVGALFDAEMAMQDRVENTGTRLEEELIERQRQADEEVRRAIDELPLITTDDSQDTEGVSGEVEGGQETGGTVQDETGGGEAVETGGVLQTPEEVTPLGEISDEEFKTFEDTGEVSQERKQDIARKIATPGVILSDTEEVVRQAFPEEIQAMVDEATPPEVIAQEVVDALPPEVKTSTTATGVQSLGKILTDVFGLKAGKVQGTAKLMDTMIGKMAQRAGVSKKTMYSRLEFQKVTEEQLDQIRAEGGESVLSRQRTGKRQQAAVRLLQDGRAIIYAISNPNVSSPLHELSHVFERFLTKAEIQTILSSAGVDVNTLDEEGLRNAWTTDISEFFARGFERYLYEGASMNQNIRAVFDKFKTWLLEIYNDFLASDIDVPINDAMRGIYANMLGQDVVILNPSTPRGSQTALEDSLLNEIFGRTLFQEASVPRGLVQIYEDFKKVLPRDLFSFDSSKHPELLEAVNRFRETEEAKTLPTNIQASLYGYSQEQDGDNLYLLLRDIEVHIAETDLLEHERRNRPVYLAMIDDLIDNSDEQRLRINRLPQGIEQEGRRGKLAQISSVLHARERANREKFSPERFVEEGEFIFPGSIRRRFQILSREIEEDLIRIWAEKQGILYNSGSFEDIFGDNVISSSSAESVVYLHPDGFDVVKEHSAPGIQAFSEIEDNRTTNGWMRFLDRLTIGNAVMPGDAQELVGFVEREGKMKAVLLQPFVIYEVPEDQPDQVLYEPIVEEMEQLGFTEIEKYKFRRGPIIVKDGHANNFVKDDYGYFRIIDGIWSLDTPSEGFGGTESIGYEPSELEVGAITRLQPLVTKQSVIDAVRVLAASTEAPVDIAAAYRSGRATYEAVGLSEEEFEQIVYQNMSDLEPNLVATLNNGHLNDTPKEYAKRLRAKKIRGAFSAVDFGLSTTIYNGALEFMAVQVERGTKIGNAISVTIAWVDKQMQRAPWDKRLFARYLSEKFSSEAVNQIDNEIGDDYPANSKPKKYKGVSGIDNFTAKAIESIGIRAEKGKTTIDDINKQLEEYVRNFGLIIDSETTYVKDVSDSFFDDKIAEARQNLDHPLQEIWEYNKQHKDEFLSLQRSAQKSDLQHTYQYITSQENGYSLGFQVYLLDSVRKYYKKNVNGFSINPIATSVIYNEYQDSDRGILSLHQEVLKSVGDSAVPYSEYAQKVYKKTPEGSWLRFPQTDSLQDAELLNRLAVTTVGRGDWCTGGSVSTAQTQLSDGDFYLFMGNDGKAKVAIRYSGQSTIAEAPRGTLEGQNLNIDEADILAKELPSLPGGEKYMSQVRQHSLVKKVLGGEVISVEEFYYLLRGRSFGYMEDPYLKEAKYIVGDKEYIKTLFGLSDTEIWESGDIHPDTKVLMNFAIIRSGKYQFLLTMNTVSTEGSAIVNIGTAGDEVRTYDKSTATIATANEVVSAEGSSTVNIETANGAVIAKGSSTVNIETANDEVAIYDKAVVDIGTANRLVIATDKSTATITTANGAVIAKGSSTVNIETANRLVIAKGSSTVNIETANEEVAGRDKSTVNIQVANKTIYGTVNIGKTSTLFQAPTDTNLPTKEVALQKVRDLRDRGETVKVSLDNLYEKGKPYLDKIGITREEFMEAATPVSGWQQTVNQFTPDTGGIPGGPVTPPIAVTPTTTAPKVEGPAVVEQDLESRSVDKIMEWGVFQAADEFVTPESYETLVRIGKLEDTPENRAAYLTTRMKIEASQATMNSLLYDILSDFTTEGRTRNDFDVFILGILNDNRINDDAKTAILNTAYSWELSPSQRRLLDNKWVELGQRASRALNLRRALSRDPFLSNEDMGLIRDAMLSSGGPNAADMRGVLDTLESLEEDSAFEDADLIDSETEEQTQARIRALEAELDATESEEFTKTDEGLAGAADLAAVAMSNLLGPETQQESEALGKKKGMARKKARIVNTVRDQVNEARKLC